MEVQALPLGAEEGTTVLTGRRRRLLAAASGTAVLLAGCSVPETGEGSLADLVPAEIADRGAVVVASDLDNPPAGFSSPIEFEGVAGAAVESGEFTGFDVQLVQDAANLLGLRVEWLEVPFSDVLSAVTQGRADLAASAITVTPERARDLAFVTYFETGTQWVTSSANELGIFPNSACGARVAVQEGTIQVADLAARSAQCQSDGRPAVDAVEYPLQSDVSAALLSGEADAFLSDQPAAQWAVRQGGGPIGAASTTTTKQLTFAGSSYDVQPYGLAFDPEQTELAQAFVAALKQLVADGSYGQILEFWSVEDGAIPAEEITLVD
jgi:polar amino acid transport system substrate-binding protein